MPVDREATLKQAEKLLRQGRLDGAIAEYVRLIQDQPKDWNSVNALGDLYVRAGQTDKAVEQFARVADFLFAEGFLPRAAALYKKILKIKSNNEYAQLQLADIATRQDLLVDAKAYLKLVGEQRKWRGDTRGAAEIAIRMGTLDPEDADAKVVAARAARQLGDTVAAATLLQEAADVFDRVKRSADALAALTEAFEIDPGDDRLRTRLAHLAVEAGDLAQSERFLNAESAGDDPRLLLMLARKELQAGQVDGGRAALTRLLSQSSDRRAEAVTLGCQLAEQGQLDAAFGCIDLIADLALLDGDWGAAASALQAFVERVPGHTGALMKLIEICVDGGLNDSLVATQARLADAYLAEGRGMEARMIAEDLVAREPSVPANLERFRQALVLLGEPDPDAVIAERLSGENPFEVTDGPVDVTSIPDVAVDSVVTPEPPTAETTEPEPPVIAAPEPQSEDASNAAATQGDEIVLESFEIDLSEALATLTAAPRPDVTATPARPPDLEGVFEELRARVASQDEARQQYQAGLEHLAAGRTFDAARALEAAARVPVLRFEAGAQLGRMHIAAGDVGRGVEWLERAAEAPAPTPEEAHALLFDLAEALERHGEGARALAILLELDADMPDYRDVSTRIDRLSRVQTGG